MSEKRSMDAETLKTILDSRHVEVVKNEITRQIEIYDHDGILYGSETPQDSLIAYIADQYRTIFKYCDKEHLTQSLLLIADRNTVNPILGEIQRATIEDKHDYAYEISHDILRISPADKLSHLLIKKAIRQAVAMLLNDSNNPYGADGILVFVGSQGIGKSLASECFAIDSKYYRSISFNAYADEADILAKTSGCFIGEISELERSLKPSSIEMFKALITSGKDTYRPKYGRSINDYVRRSTFIATCNTNGFLYDTTGNRRFWTIPCENCFDIERLTACKNGEDDIFVKAYKQEYLYLQKHGMQSFRLTAEEREALEQRNGKYLHKSDIEDVLKTILIACGLKEFTIAQLKEDYSELRLIDSAVIGRSLKKLEIPQKTRKIEKDGYQSTERYYQNIYSLQ